VREVTEVLTWLNRCFRGGMSGSAFDGLAGAETSSVFLFPHSSRTSVRTSAFSGARTLDDAFDRAAATGSSSRFRFLGASWTSSRISTGFSGCPMRQAGSAAPPIFTLDCSFTASFALPTSASDRGCFSRLLPLSPDFLNGGSNRDEAWVVVPEAEADCAIP
jgi:hypothetical protein